MPLSVLPKTDIWRVGILPAPMSAIVQNGLGECAPIWLPVGRSFTYLADPFGLWRDGTLYVFVETYDYRTRRGGIDVLTLDEGFAVVDQRPCLRMPWHLSYPYVFEMDGETYMLPEAHKSGRLTLYRAQHFPNVWTRACDIVLDATVGGGLAVDATPVFYDGLWWMFYAPATNLKTMMGELNAAYAEQITGPWKAHKLNPLRKGLDGARPGGTPVVIGNTLVVPLQDCSRSYGSGLRALTIHKIGPDSFDADIGPSMVGGSEFEPYVDGFHTLSDCGPVTLFDAKTIDRSMGKWLVDAGRAPIVARKAFADLQRKLS